MVEAQEEKMEEDARIKEEGSFFLFAFVCYTLLISAKAKDRKSSRSSFERRRLLHEEATARPIARPMGDHRDPSNRKQPRRVPSMGTCR